jgi:hypothetical protein
MSILPFFYDAAFGRSHGSDPLKDGRTSPDAQPMPAQEGQTARPSTLASLHRITTGLFQRNRPQTFAKSIDQIGGTDVSSERKLANPCTLALGNFYGRLLGATILLLVNALLATSDTLHCLHVLQMK